MIRGKTIMKARFFIATIALAAGALMAKDYSGAELYSKETWMYGKFEARMQMAAGSGTADQSNQLRVVNGLTTLPICPPLSARTRSTKEFSNFAAIQWN